MNYPGDQICDNILRFEHLSEDFNRLSENNGLNIHFPAPETQKTSAENQIGGKILKITQAHGWWGYNMLVWVISGLSMWVYDTEPYEGIYIYIYIYIYILGVNKRNRLRRRF